MGDLNKLILDVLQQAVRPVTIREIALDIGGILGTPVDKKQIDGVLRADLGELALVDACRRWRLASRTDLSGTIPRVVDGKEGADRQRHASGLVFDKRDRYAELIKDDPAVKSILEWAAELDAEKARLQAEIEQHGGHADVWILRDLSGNEINAKVVNGKNSAEWALLDALGRVTRTRLPYRPLQQADLREKGYLESRERRPAAAMIIFASSGEVAPCGSRCQACRSRTGQASRDQQGASGREDHRAVSAREKGNTIVRAAYHLTTQTHTLVPSACLKFLVHTVLVRFLAAAATRFGQSARFFRLRRRHAAQIRDCLVVDRTLRSSCIPRTYESRNSFFIRSSCLSFFCHRFSFSKVRICLGRSGCLLPPRADATRFGSPRRLSELSKNRLSYLSAIRDTNGTLFPAHRIGGK